MESNGIFCECENDSFMTQYLLVEIIGEANGFSIYKTVDEV